MWNGKKISLIIPAFNEERGIALTLADFNQDIFDEIIVIDNNSQDNTAAVAIELNVKVVQEPCQGYGAAIKRGMVEATGDLIVIIEADHSFSFRDMAHLLPPLENYDLVLGSRTKQSWEEIGVPFHDFIRLANILLGKIASIFCNKLALTDVGCTFRVIRRELRNKLLPILNEKGPEFSLEMILKAGILGAKIIELPVTYKKRVGESKNASSFLKFIKNGIKMVYVLVTCLIVSRRIEKKSRLSS